MTVGAVLSGVVLSGAILSAVGAIPAAAQQPVVIGGSGQPDVFVNMQVLNSLGPGPGYPSPYGYAAPAAPYGYPAPYGYAPPVAAYNGYTPQYVTRPGTLLYPPPTPPQSQITLHMPGAVAQPQTAEFNQPGLQLTPPPGMTPSRGMTPTAAEPAPPPAPSDSAPSSPSASPPPPVPSPQVAERAPEPAPEAMSQAESAPEATAEPPAAEAAPELPAVPPPSLDAAESAPPAVPEEAAPVPAPQAGTPAPETEQAENGATLTPPPPPAAPAEPQSESAASDLPAAPQTSALTPGSEEDLLRLTFAEGSADLNEEAKDSLRALAQTLLEDGNARVQLLAYASSADDSASRARRLSLSRALAVRAYLIDQGVRSTRMDVRALGSKAEDGPSDRVDILPAQR